MVTISKLILIVNISIERLNDKIMLNYTYIACEQYLKACKLRQTSMELENKNEVYMILGLKISERIHKELR